MNVYCTGANGYLGRAFVKAGCKPLEVNVTDYEAVEREILCAKPELVLHLAGVSDPDKCESDFEVAMKANVRGTYNVMENCAKNSIPAVLLSSSQVWGGGWWESIWNRHAEDSKMIPAVNSYGSQKAAAEFCALSLNINGDRLKVIRSSFVFDKERLCERLEDLKHGVPIDAPKFLKRSFIHKDDFVFLVSKYCKEFYSMPDVLHLAGSEVVSYYDFWVEVARQFGYDKKLVKGRKKEKEILAVVNVNGVDKVFPSVKRPHNAGLDIRLSQKLGFPSFNYRGGIKRMKDE
jgi:dTDP-4-dehydrorhamnose reductase